MRLSWPEIRARAAKFSADHAGDRYEKSQTQTFYNEFFACFGVDRKQVAVYEQRVRNLSGDRQGFIDLFMPGVLIVEQKSAGLDLRAASNQALDYYQALPEVQRPRYVLTCDFQNWRLVDLQENGRQWNFKLADLKKHIEAFAFIVGVPQRQFRNQKPANPAASELLGKLHRQLAADGYAGHQLQLLLVRLLFVLFADDTGIWPKDQFLVLLEQQTQPDGRDLGRWLTDLFGVLDTPEAERQASLDPVLAAFPHINGKLFEEPIRTATFDNALRDILLDASVFDWGSVSPAIFGALFESVIDRVTQRRQGAHYTPEEAIQKVIGPLFLDDLYAEFDAIKARKDGARAKALATFHDKLAALTFFDPACGAGNFLVVAYREMRELERLLLLELHPPETRQLVMDVALLSRLNVNSFYGIEIDEFPSQIAQVALWMTDHIANTNLGDDFGRPYARVPLVTAPNIRCADALEIDWAEVLPPERCNYVFGNPPFVGAKMQTAAQRAQVRRLAKLGGSGGTLDYVAAWFLKAGDYIQGGPARIAFVATNSICQGEQVAQLWPKLFYERRLEIAFAHRTFLWPGRAQVHCVIVGLAQQGDEPAQKRLFTYASLKGEAVETTPAWMTAYLHPISFEFRFQTVAEVASPLSYAPRLMIGSKPIDGGYLIFDASERQALLEVEPNADPFLRPYVGSKEFINGGCRWIISLQDASPSAIRALPKIRERLNLVRSYRLGNIPARGKKTRAQDSGTSAIALADTPATFHVTVLPQSPFLVIPEVSSESRDYIPVGWASPPIIPSNKLRLLPNATLFHFAILTSKIHMAWTDHIGGRLKSDYQYGIGLNYNTFPWPKIMATQRVKVEALAQAVLDARAMPKNATATLADLYHPDGMPLELRRAHKALDAAVDRLYTPKGFPDDRARVEHLFKLYEALVMPTTAAATANRRTARRVKRAAAD